MQFLIEIMAAVVVWAAAFAFSQFGLEIDLSRPAPAQESRTVERSPRPAAQPAAKPANEDCPEAAKARVHRV